MAWKQFSKLRLLLSNIGTLVETVWGTISGAIQDQADLWRRIRDQKVVHTLSDMAEFYNAVDGFYDITAGRYVWDNHLTFDFPLRFVTQDGFYTFKFSNIYQLTWAGTTSFITNRAGVTGNALKMDDGFLNTPMSTAIELVDADTILLTLVVFNDCKKCAKLTRAGFVTLNDEPMVLCENGFDLIDCSTITAKLPQWNLGQDLGGSAFKISGSATERLITSTIDSRPAASESMFLIEASASNVDVDISGGVHDGLGDFFGDRDQTDVDFSVRGVKNVPDSQNEIGVYNTAEATTEFTANDQTNVVQGTFTTSTSERFAISSPGGNLRVTYTGKADLNGAFIIAKSQAVPTSGSTVLYCQHIRVTPIATGTPVLDPQSVDEAEPSNNNPRKSISVTSLDLKTGDYFEYVTTSVGHQQDANFTSISIVVKG